MSNVAIKIYKKEGGAKMIGRNVFYHHKESPSRQILGVANQRKNIIYTTERRGLKKLVSITVFSDLPLFADLHQEGGDQTQAGGFVGKDTHHPGSPADLLVDAPQAIGGADGARVFQRKIKPVNPSARFASNQAERRDQPPCAIPILRQP
jgi:hypothetical protein